MKLKKYQLYLIICIGSPIWVIGWGVLILDYLMDLISADTAKNILGFILTVTIWYLPLKIWGNKKIDV